VSELLGAATVLSSSQWPALRDQWVKISHVVGGRLPASTLTSSVQEIGQLDLLLRSVEAEWRPQQTAQIDYAFTCYSMLSDLWIGAIYEVFRLLESRKLSPDSDEFRALARDLKLLRIPLEKHEIADDKRLSQPLRMRRIPSHGDETDLYEYTKADPQRAHIMAKGVSPLGSIMWQVTDVKQFKSYWLERRSISERVVAIWHSSPA
jgi:hypothetical protein